MNDPLGWHCATMTGPLTNELFIILMRGLPAPAMNDPLGWHCATMTGPLTNDPFIIILRETHLIYNGLSGYRQEDPRVPQACQTQRGQAVDNDVAAGPHQRQEGLALQLVQTKNSPTSGQLRQNRTATLPGLCTALQVRSDRTFAHFGRLCCILQLLALTDEVMGDRSKDLTGPFCE
jgi:hypothetical protein